MAVTSLHVMRPRSASALALLGNLGYDTISHKGSECQVRVRSAGQGRFATVLQGGDFVVPGLRAEL